METITVAAKTAKPNDTLAIHPAQNEQYDISLNLKQLEKACAIAHHIMWAIRAAPRLRGRVWLTIDELLLIYNSSAGAGYGAMTMEGLSIALESLRGDFLLFQNQDKEVSYYENEAVMAELLTRDPNYKGVLSE